jgi:GalNAc-alpha-(1->4)-GalNAc-alpha-(1->3)-diNAcBac-PP-undecaprenol alpha-1,4-N-acetyl-D-galactosaminyltransferase
VKIALVISSLGPGGAERVMSILANAWAVRGTEVTLITLGNAGGDFYRIDPRVRRVGLGVAAHSSNALAGAVRNVRRILALRAALRSEKPDVVVSFMTTTNVLSVLACRPLRIPCIVSERTSPPNPNARGLWALGFGYAYQRAQGIVAQTGRAADWLRHRFPSVPVHVIANPVVLNDSSGGEEDMDARLRSTIGEPFIVAMGRLSVEKGFDLLLEAFAGAAASRPSWSLAVIGEGPERPNLGEQMKRLGLSRQVHLVGLVRNPQALLRRAAMFVLPSRYEGMPTALLEAMACGLPCISFDCPSGPREIINDGTNGLLVPPGDVPGLARALGRVMDDDGLRRRLGLEAVNVVRDHAVDRIIAQWDKLVGDLVLPEPGRRLETA